MPPPNDQSAQSGEDYSSSEWLSRARILLSSLTRAEQAIEATLARHDLSAAESPAIDFLVEQVSEGLGWLEHSPAEVPTVASTELRAALGVLRNLAYAMRRLSAGENPVLRRSCEALIEQSRDHVQAAAGAIEDAGERLS